MSDEIVSVISGSKSDEKVVISILNILEQFEINHETKIISAHRNPSKLRKYIIESKANIFIGVAGMAAHLPGVIASLTIKPVIGVPVSGNLSGLDSLLSIVQMPSGVPVATVAIDNGKNAGLLAVEILAINNIKLKNNLLSYRQKMEKI
jgi:5-(carboxyamino)imidazole ribonucleotide mutase